MVDISCGFPQCQKAAKRFCLCTDPVTMICDAHLGDHLDSIGKHWISNSYRQLDDSERERVQEELACLELTTQKVLKAERDALNRDTQKILSTLRLRSRQHTCVINCIIEDTNEARENLKSLLEKGLVHDSCPQSCRFEDCLANCLPKFNEKELLEKYRRGRQPPPTTLWEIHLHTKIRLQRKMREAVRLRETARRTTKVETQAQLFNNAESIYREFNSSIKLAKTLVEFGIALTKQSKSSQALELFREAERSCRPSSLSNLLTDNLPPMGERVHLPTLQEACAKFLSGLNLSWEDFDPTKQ